MHVDITTRLRDAVQKLRRTSMPIADVAPMLTEAADIIEHLRKELTLASDDFVELYHLREAVKGPDGFDTWQAAAVAERVRRVNAEKALVDYTKFIVLPRELDEDLYYMVGGALGAESPEQCGRADPLWEKLVKRSDSDRKFI